jgi:hypothetical protein
LRKRNVGDPARWAGTGSIIGSAQILAAIDCDSLELDELQGRGVGRRQARNTNNQRCDKHDGKLS